MKTIFKFISILSILLFSFFTYGQYFIFNSFSYDPNFEDVVDWINSKDITKYSDESSFRPYDYITREQAAKFFVEFQKNVFGNMSEQSSNCIYKDQWQFDYTLKDSIMEACRLGIMKGSNGYFNPKLLFTKAEAITVLIRILEGDLSENSTPWWNNYFNRAKELSLTTETNAYSLSRNILRGETALMLFRAGKIKSNDTDNTNINNNASNDFSSIISNLLGTSNINSGINIYGTTNSGIINNSIITISSGTITTGVINLENNGNINQTYTLNNGIFLNPSSPSSQLIPSAGTVLFGKFDIKAGNSDLIINSIKITREGLGQRTDINRVWFEVDGTRVTSRQSLGSDNISLLIFYPSLTIKANSTKTLDLVSSLNGTSTNSQHRFSIVSINDISASESINGYYPISTNFMSTTSYQVSSVIFTAGGGNSTYNVGNRNVELGQFRIQNNAITDNDVVFNGITFRNEGNGDIIKNLSNIGIYRGSTLVSNSYKIDGRYITFSINGDKIPFGRQEVYYIRADIIGADNSYGDNYQFSVRYSDDINIIESGTKFKARILGIDSGINLSNYFVNGGTTIISRSNIYSSSQTVAPGTNDVILLSANLNITQPINLGDLKVSLNNSSYYSGTLSDLANSFTLLKLKIGNNIVATYNPVSSSLNWFIFEGNYTVNYSTNIQILGNLRTTAYGTYQFSEISYGDFGIREYISNGNTIQSSELIGTVGGIVTTVGSASINITRNDGLSNQSIVAGAGNRTLMQFIVNATDVSDIRINKLRFNSGPSTSNGFTLAYVTNLRLYANNQLVSTKNMNAGYVEFYDINIYIQKNSNVTFRIEGDFSNSIPLGQSFQLSIVGNNSIEARDINSTLIDVNPNVYGPTYTFINAGSVTIYQNSSTPNSLLITPSSNEIEIGRYTFSSIYDTLRLTDIYFYNRGTANLSTRLQNISLYNLNGTKLAGGSIIGSGLLIFSLGNSSPFIIQKDSSNTVLIVKAGFNDITNIEDDSKTLILSVGTGDYNVNTINGTINGVRLISDSVGNVVSNVSLLNPVSNTHLLVRSKPFVSINSYASQSSHTFTISSDSNNRIILTGVQLSVSNPSGGPTTYTLYKDTENNGNIVANGSFVNGSFWINFNQGVEISAGSSKSFILSVGNLSSTPQINSKRIIRITDLKYMDIMNSFSNNLIINSISIYSNVGLPSVESTFNY